MSGKREGLLVAGPWVGELGWEIACWQGRVRKAAAGHARTVVCCPVGHGVLYRDFADEIREADVPGVRDCWKVSGDGGRGRTVSASLDVLGGVRLVPDRRYAPEEQDFVSLRRPGPEGFDVVVHARGRFGPRASDSWPADQWDRLCGRLLGAGLTVACIGHPGQSLRPAGCIDRRSVRLETAVGLLSASRLAAGPSSGPMVLASFCLTRHVVWGDRRVWTASGGVTIREKFEKAWSPFGTRCRVIDDHGWRPPVDRVAEAVFEELE